MKNGLFVGSSADYIERYSQKSADLSLIGKGGTCEIMIQNITKGSNAFVEPGDLPETMEFFYVLEGELSIPLEDETKELKRGDYFYSHHLTETIHFETKTDVKLLYISNEPVFKYLSSTIQELTEIAKEVEIKDVYTHGHSMRVKDYSVMIANKLNLSKERIENLTYASLFHDIGKIDIPDEILNKPSRLTDEEYEIIKKHPENGIRFVEKTYYNNIGEIILQHHERIDGSGYPRGLKEDEILLEAKIIAVADTYDAMTTSRPYRTALPIEVAIDELVKYSGTHYDKKIVDVLVKEIKKQENGEPM